MNMTIIGFMSLQTQCDNPTAEENLAAKLNEQSQIHQPTDPPPLDLPPPLKESKKRVRDVAKTVLPIVDKKSVRVLGEVEEFCLTPSSMFVQNSNFEESKEQSFLNAAALAQSIFKANSYLFDNDDENAKTWFEMVLKQDACNEEALRGLDQIEKRRLEKKPKTTKTIFKILERPGLSNPE